MVGPVNAASKRVKAQIQCRLLSIAVAKRTSILAPSYPKLRKIVDQEKYTTNPREYLTALRQTVAKMPADQHRVDNLVDLLILPSHQSFADEVQQRIQVSKGTDKKKYPWMSPDFLPYNRFSSKNWTKEKLLGLKPFPDMDGRLSEDYSFKDFLLVNSITKVAGTPTERPYFRSDRELIEGVSMADSDTVGVYLPIKQEESIYSLLNDQEKLKLAQELGNVLASTYYDTNIAVRDGSLTDKTLQVFNRPDGSLARPKRVLEEAAVGNHIGVCAHSATALVGLLLELGYPTSTLGFQTNKEHVYVNVKVGDKSLLIDPTPTDTHQANSSADEELDDTHFSPLLFLGDVPAYPRRAP